MFSSYTTMSVLGDVRCEHLTPEQKFTERYLRERKRQEESRKTRHDRQAEAWDWWNNFDAPKSSEETTDTPRVDSTQCAPVRFMNCVTVFDPHAGTNVGVCR